MQRHRRVFEGERPVGERSCVDLFLIVYSRCKKCKGGKTMKEKVRQEIFIEKGMTDRQRIVLAGAGDQEVC